MRFAPSQGVYVACCTITRCVCCVLHTHRVCMLRVAHSQGVYVAFCTFTGCVCCVLHHHRVCMLHFPNAINKSPCCLCQLDKHYTLLHSHILLHIQYFQEQSSAQPNREALHQSHITFIYCIFFLYIFVTQKPVE